MIKLIKLFKLCMLMKYDSYFPHDNVREIQEDLIKDVVQCFKDKKHMIVHAPTGLGKTAAALPPALEYAKKHKLTVFFLTSRHTQHKIGVDTLKDIKKKHGVTIRAVDLIGKKWMCSKTVELLHSGEFADYCKKLREDDNCEFYNNTKKDNKPTPKATNVLAELKLTSPCHVEELIEQCDELCPYEMAGLLARKADVIIADYNYIFNPRIRDAFLLKSGIELEKSIIIVDEAHNVPKRVRELLTVKINSFILKGAINECDKFKYHEVAEKLNAISNTLDELSVDNEKIVKGYEFVKKINSYYDYDEMINEFAFVGEEIRDKQKRSFVGGIGNFLEQWTGEDEGFARIISRKGNNVELSYRCLDPSLLTKEVAEKAYSVIFMSGTLTPTFMYKDILGFDDAVEREFESPFPSENKLSLVVPITTTKYTRRGEKEYKKMATILAQITDEIPGNSAVFFPSYHLRDEVYRYFYDLGSKTVLLEKQGMTKSEKSEFLEKFKEYKVKGAVLLGVAAGSFGEGIDLPGDFLKCVIIVGLPLERPNLETKELINYYDAKFSKGWDYAYIFPAIQKVLQNAGRCIRSETDRGVVVFLDERWAWPNYYRCIPQDFNVKVSKDYLEKIKEFFC